MVGNRLHKGYDSIRNDDYTLTECFEDNQVNRLWENVTTVDTFFLNATPLMKNVKLQHRFVNNGARFILYSFPIGT